MAEKVDRVVNPPGPEQRAAVDCHPQCLADPSNPSADHSEAQLYQFLSTVQLTRDIGSEVEYSALGAALLG